MATVYIATTGNDTTGDGSEGNPWATLAKAHDTATTGDTVEVAAGTYTWEAETTSKHFTVNGAALSNGLPTSIFDGASANFVWNMNTDQEWTFNDLWFKNLTRTAGGNNGVFDGNGGGECTFNRCVFTDIVTTTSSGNHGLNGLFNFSTASGEGVVLNNCVMSRISGASTAVWSALFGSVEATVNNCSIYLEATTNHLHYISDGTGTKTFKNTIVYNAGDSLVFNSTGTSVATYCDINGITSAPAGTGNISADPLFIDQANDNYRLKATSTCIGVGTII